MDYGWTCLNCLWVHQGTPLRSCGARSIAMISHVYVHVRPSPSTYTVLTTMANGQQQLCFSCDENVRLDGDFLCRSCKEEYRKCYECGERERNHPFKLCKVCYLQLRDGGTAVPVATSAVTTAASHTSTISGRSTLYSTEVVGEKNGCCFF